MVTKHIHFILWTAFGAALGAMLREGILYLLDVSANHSWVIILLINMTGTFIIAVVYEVEHRLHENITIFTAIGFCGGFTTFSHFTHHTVAMILSGDYVTPIVNILLSLLGTLAAGYIGILAVRLLFCLRNRLRGGL